jgi:hypothetical protein
MDFVAYLRGMLPLIDEYNMEWKLSIVVYNTAISRETSECSKSRSNMEEVCAP